MNYRRCLHCGTLISEDWVFCTDECWDAHLGLGPIMIWPISTDLSGEQLARLRFVRWGVFRGWQQFSEHRVNMEVKPEFLRWAVMA